MSTRYRELVRWAYDGEVFGAAFLRAVLDTPWPALRPWQRTVRRDLADTVRESYQEEVWLDGGPYWLRAFHAAVVGGLDDDKQPRNVYPLLAQLSMLWLDPGRGR